MRGRDEHGEIGFAAGARKRRRDVMLFPFRRFDAEDEHVLGEPTLLAREIGADAQSETFFREQDIATVTGADRDDRVVLRKMADPAAVGIDVEQRMQAAIPFAILLPFEPPNRDLAHARHDAHAQDDVDRVGDFEADFGERRIRRTHDVGNDEHRPSPHRAFEHLVQLRVGLRGRGPVIRWTGFLFRRRADEGELLDPRDVVLI